jgi:hypothetical protein
LAFTTSDAAFAGFPMQPTKTGNLPDTLQKDSTTLIYELSMLNRLHTCECLSKTELSHLPLRDHTYSRQQATDSHLASQDNRKGTESITSMTKDNQQRKQQCTTHNV